MKRIWRSSLALLAILGGGMAWADDPTGSQLQLMALRSLLEPEARIQPTSYAQSKEATPFEEEESPPPSSPASPSRRPAPVGLPPTPVVPSDPAASPAAAVPPAELPPPADPGSAATSSSGHESCSGCCECSECCEERPGLLRRLRNWVDVGGWLDQGITLNPDSPANRFNGPVTFNDRSNEYQLNQFYLYLEHKAETCGSGWDIGGRVDLLYGTDQRFTVAHGLEDKWNEGQRFYGVAMPQLYMDVAINDLTVRMGHFYTIIGYEGVPAPNNFFYSHSYMHQYGEPFTHTGLLATYKLNDRWSVAGGLHRGWDQWEDINHDLGFLGGIAWTSEDQRTSASFALTSSNEDHLGENNRSMYSVVFTRKIGQRLKYVFQHDLGYEDGASWDGTGAEWYGFNNYLFYQWNEKWAFGLRYEWFSDDDGVRVRGLGYPKGINLAAIPAQWNELSVGLNWKPKPRLILRSELRWDWVKPLVDVPDGPFDDYTQRSQLLWGTDLILTF